MTLIVIAGGTGAGKSTLARTLAEKWPDDQVLLLGQDRYYHDLSDESPRERAKRNFDHPDAIDFGLLETHLRALRAGHPVELPEYDFAAHTRTGATTPVEPADLVVLEGIFALRPDWIHDLADARVFIETPEEVRLKRRLERDTRERGRVPTEVLRQFTQHARPMHVEHVEPTRAKADLVLSGEAHPHENADSVFEFLRSAAGQRP